MDDETRRDMESMAEWASTQDAYDRLLERRARRRRILRFWLSPWQIADDPVAAESAPEDPGAGSGVAGSETTASQTSAATQGAGGARRFAGTAGPRAQSASDAMGLATPHPHAWT